MFIGILNQEAPGLADCLQSLTLEQQRRIVAKACVLASQAIVDLELEVRDLLRTMTGDNALSKVQVAEAKTLATSADDRYFTLQEQGALEAVWLNWFGKARLLTAIWNGFGGTSWKDTADAIYELTKT